MNPFLQKEARMALDRVNKNIRIKLDQLADIKSEGQGAFPQARPQRIEYDLEQIKKVPCNLITDIAPSGFFIVNPFRNFDEHASRLSATHPPLALRINRLRNLGNNT